ncbi:MAG TPA: hypothetical protein VJ692_03475 [Nitrospiraceae bacterium]|nr:hypothetical protein [Nitrospiraceae bacterium]
MEPTSTLNTMSRKLGLIVCTLLVLSLPSHASAVVDSAENPDRHERSEEYADRKLIRPSPKERVAIIKLLERKPRPKTFIDADIKYLRALLEKAVWTGAERRILGEIWQEVTGRPFEPSQSESPDER